MEMLPFFLSQFAIHAIIEEKGLRVSHSLVVVGAVGLIDPLYLWDNILRQGPFFFLSLKYPSQILITEVFFPDSNY